MNECMCASFMYASVLYVCMYSEYRKKYTILNFLCWDWLFWRLLCVQASGFPSAGVI